MRQIGRLRTCHVGVDFGQRKNHTAIVVVEQRVEPVGELDRVTYEPVCERRLGIRMVERVPLGVSYAEVMGGLERLVAGLPVEGRGRRTTLAMDTTGITGWVVDDARRRRMGAEVFPVVLTGGERGREREGYWCVPRTELLLGVSLAFETQGLEVAAGVEQWRLLKEECRGMRRVATGAGVEFRTEGRQDDLVFALGLALWGAGERPLPGHGAAVRRAVMGITDGPGRVKSILHP